MCLSITQGRILGTTPTTLLQVQIIQGKSPMCRIPNVGAHNSAESANIQLFAGIRLLPDAQKQPPRALCLSKHQQVRDKRCWPNARYTSLPSAFCLRQGPVLAASLNRQPHKGRYLLPHSTSDLANLRAAAIEGSPEAMPKNETPLLCLTADWHVTPQYPLCHPTLTTRVHTHKHTYMHI